MVDGGRGETIWPLRLSHGDCLVKVQVQSVCVELALGSFIELNSSDFFKISKIASIMSGRVLVYGGRGALGAACVSHFKAQNWVSLQFN